MNEIQDCCSVRSHTAFFGKVQTVVFVLFWTEVFKCGFLFFFFLFEEHDSLFEKIASVMVIIHNWLFVGY